MSALWRRVMFSLVVLFWSGVLLHVYLTGLLQRYLAPDFRPYVLIGGLGLAVMGLFTLMTSREVAVCGHSHGADEDHDHESLDVHPAVAMLILVVPVAMCLMWTKHEFSSAILGRKGLFDSPQESGSLLLGSMIPKLTKEVIEQQHPMNEAGYHPFDLMELFFSSGDPEMKDLVEGMKVETEGRMVADPDGPPHQRRVYRFFITCCAADSRAIPIIVRFNGDVPSFEENQWVKVSGTMRYPDEGQGPMPVLEVDQVVEGQAPPEDAFMRGAF